MWWSTLTKSAASHDVGWTVFALADTADSPTLRLLISGIPSRRVDSIGRPARWTIVVEADQADAGVVEQLARAALTEGGREALGSALDDELGDDVDEIIDPARDARLGDDVLTERALSAFRKVDWEGLGVVAESQDGDDVDHAVWVGSVGDGEAEKAFFGRLSALSRRMAAGWAITLNLAKTPEAVAALAGQLDAPVAALLGPGLMVGITPLPGKAGAVPAKATTSGRSRKQLLQLVSAVVVVAVAVAAIVWATYRRFRR